MVLHSSHDQLIMEITELRNSSKNKRIGTELTKSKIKERIRFSSSAVLNIISNNYDNLCLANLEFKLRLFSSVWSIQRCSVLCLTIRFALCLAIIAVGEDGTSSMITVNYMFYILIIVFVSSKSNILATN